MQDLGRPAAVVLDLDGTLVDTVPTRIVAWGAVFDETGIAWTPEQLAPLIGIDGRRLAREVAASAGRTLDDAEADAIDRRSGELFDARNTAPRPLAGATELLARLDARGMTWAIATSSRREQVAASVAALHLARAPRIVDGSHVEHAKPAPDLLLLAARELGIDPREGWYVGDSTWDMESARAAGMTGIGVTAGAALGADALRASGASVVIASLDDLHLPR